MAVLRGRVQQHFKSIGTTSTGGRSLAQKAFIILSIFAVLYTVPLAIDLSWPWLVLIYGVQGIVLSLIGFNIMHDGSHGSFSDNKTINTITAYSLNLLGGNAFFWKQKHCINHHTFTNIEDVDDDIDLKPFLRLHDEQKHLWFHKYQHIYACFLYTVTLLFWIHYRDYKKYFTRKIAVETPMEDITVSQHFIFWISKILHLVLFLYIPSLFIPFSIVLGGYLLMTLTCGLSLAVVFQLAHIVEGTAFEAANAENNKVAIPTEWSIHQINTTVNFAMKNPVWTWLLGGLNYQMVHHLFPKISHVHYPVIHNIITDCCKEYGISYLEFPTMRMAFASHIRQLRAMGVPPMAAG